MRLVLDIDERRIKSAAEEKVMREFAKQLPSLEETIRENIREVYLGYAKEYILKDLSERIGREIHSLVTSKQIQGLVAKMINEKSDEILKGIIDGFNKEGDT